MLLYGCDLLGARGELRHINTRPIAELIKCTKLILTRALN